MAEKFAHALAAMAAMSLMGLAAGYPMLSYGVFVAGIFAVLLDMDERRSPTSRYSVFSHSVLFGTYWCYAALCVFLFLGVIGWIEGKTAWEMTLAMVAAVSSHLLLDAFSKDGIFILPKGKVNTWFKELNDGDEKAWSSWLRFPSEEWRNSHGRVQGEPMYNMMISLASMGVLLFALAWV